MNKFLCLTLSAITIISASTTDARLKSVVTSNLNHGPLSSGRAMSATLDSPMTAEEYCPAVCEGYTAEALDCGQDMEPKACPDSDCGNYYKCMPVVCEDGYDTKLKKCALEIQPDNFRCSKCAQ